MPARPKSTGKSRRLARALWRNNSESIKVRILLTGGLSGPVLPLTVEVSDMTFVLKCKVECALRLLNETQGEGSVGVAASAEDIVLEYRGIPLRDMTTLERYGVEHNADIAARFVPQPSEKEALVRVAEFEHLDGLVMAEPGIPSTGTLKRVVAQRGKVCQVSWRGRWFRAQVLSVYSTSILLAWLDWPDAEWPNFFVRVSLAAAPATPPGDDDETWRIRWHVSTPMREMPIVQPRYRELPPLNWVKAFLRSYAAADETQMLREIQAQLPRELVEARQQAALRHHCLILGASGVGKTTLIATLCHGTPGGGDYGPGSTGRGKYWPTVGTRCHRAVVNTPGLPPMHLDAWDTSGNPRFKPLSLVFYRQAQSVVLVFDVKSMASFKAPGAVGGWMHEFTRLTGLSPRNFPFVLVGNKAEDDLMHHRQVYEEDVREWLYKDGCRMPYIETSFGGDPASSWRQAEHVFRTVARLSHAVKENLGRHQPPETVRAVEEPEDAKFLEGASFVAGSFVQSFKKRSPAGEPFNLLLARTGFEELAEGIGDTMGSLLGKAQKASAGLQMTCVRSFEAAAKAAKGTLQRDGEVARLPDSEQDGRKRVNRQAQVERRALSAGSANKQPASSTALVPLE